MTDDQARPLRRWPCFLRPQEDRHLGAVPKEHAERLLAQYQEDGEQMPEAAIIEAAAEGEAAPPAAPNFPSDLRHIVM